MITHFSRDITILLQYTKVGKMTTNCERLTIYSAASVTESSSTKLTSLVLCTFNLTKNSGLNLTFFRQRMEQPLLFLVDYLKLMLSIVFCEFLIGPNNRMNEFHFLVLQCNWFTSPKVFQVTWVIAGAL